MCRSLTQVFVVCAMNHRSSAAAAGDNGFPRSDAAATAAAFKGSYTYSNSGETWVEVCGSG